MTRRAYYLSRFMGEILMKYGVIDDILMTLTADGEVDEDDDSMMFVMIIEMCVCDWKKIRVCAAFIAH